MEIEMRTMIFYYCRQGKGGKKIHYKLSDVYGKDSYSLDVVKYWVHEFKAQRTELHDEVRPRRPLIDVSAQIARLLNEEPFCSTRHLWGNRMCEAESSRRDILSRDEGSKSVSRRVAGGGSAAQKNARLAGADHVDL
jgi:hypothetical protein